MNFHIRLAAGIAVITGLLVPSVSLGHMAGQSLEKKAGEYLVDIGYDTMEIVEGQEVRFDATLIQKPGTLQWSYAPFDEVWIQIAKEGTEPFRAVLPVKLPGPVFTEYRFPSGGNFTFSVRFLAQGKPLADAWFPLTVTTKDAQDSMAKSAALTLFVLVLLSVMGIVAYRRYTQPMERKAARPRSSRRR
jgi:hypothetical protein